CHRQRHGHAVELCRPRSLCHPTLRDGEQSPAWSCVVLVLFAIPTGLTTARQSIAKGFIFALSAFIGFYVISQFGVFLGSKGYVPPVIAAWAPNALWLVTAVALYRKLR
ncbi:MAG: LptF/LptG family permease, partial [Kiritimatiellaeota bacterium]|nr:LptF/LptG family permease [Kiritimatiellota bacterium]